MQLNTYLTFERECRQAFEFYRSVFGGDFLFIQTFGDGPPDLQVPEDEQHRVMHVSLPVGDSVLMGSDSTSAFGPPPKIGGNFSITVSPDSREDADRLLAGLADGGEMLTPMQDMFWGAYFGMCVDKFGIRWQVNFENPEG